MHTWSVKRPVFNWTLLMWFECIHNVYVPYFLEEDNYEGFLGVQMVENPYPMNNWCGLQCFGRVTPPLHPILVPPVKKHQLLKSYKQPSWPRTDQTVPICSEVNPNINLWQEVEWRGGCLRLTLSEFQPNWTNSNALHNLYKWRGHTYPLQHPKKKKQPLSIQLWAKLDQRPAKSMSLSTIHKQTNKRRSFPISHSLMDWLIRILAEMLPREDIKCYFADFVRKGELPPNPFTDKNFAEKSYGF